MNIYEKEKRSACGPMATRREPGMAKALQKANIGDSIDLLVKYLADNHVQGIHPLIMGEVESRLIITALEHSRGNKLRAAKMLGMSRNTFHKKLQRLSPCQITSALKRES